MLYAPALSLYRRQRARPLSDHPIRACDCGCGTLFTADMTNRARKYAPNCPRTVERAEAERQKQLALARQKAAARRAEKQSLKQSGRRSRRVFGSDGLERRSVKVCSSCGNMPERRPPEGCSECSFPAGPPAPITPFGQASTGYDGWSLF